MFKERVNQKHGFTLIELLVVVLIIGILAAIALPNYTKAVEKSYFSEAKIMAASIGKAQESFKLSRGGPAFAFEELPVSLTNTQANSAPVGNLAHKTGGSFRGKQFDYVIDSAGTEFWNGAIAVVRHSGDNTGGGFVFSKGELYCVNPAGSSKEFCKKMYNGTIYSAGNAGWDIYTFR